VPASSGAIVPSNAESVKQGTHSTQRRGFASCSANTVYYAHYPDRAQGESIMAKKQDKPKKQDGDKGKKDKKKDKKK
jgi:hypothetical protein